MVVAAPIDRYAKRIARDLTRGRAPSLTDEIAAYLGSGPEAIFDNLKGLLDRIANNSDEALTGAHLALLSMQLEFLSYRIDLGHREAIDLQTAFEERVAALVRESESPGLVLGLVGAAIHQAKLAAGPVLRALQQETLDDEAKDLDAELDIQSALSEVAEGCGGDVFAIIESLLSLDPDEGVRRAVAAMLAANAGPLTPTALRRLIAIRNWIPAKEQLAIDEAIRVARSSGVACASWRQATATDIRASGIDGSGAAGFAMVSPAGGKHRFSSIVFRFGEGVIDAWSTEPMAKGRLRGMLREAEGTMLRSVPRRHLDLVAQHYLAVGRERSAVPPLGLLQVAEAIGAAEWRPARLDWEATLETLIAELPRTLREPTRIERTMKDSVAWAAEDTVSASWFENDQDVVDLVAKLPASEKAVDYVLTTVVERRKLKWAERFLWMALWFKESGLGGRWPHYALLAHELARGRPVDSIPLMRMIASNTLICAGDAVWIEDGR
jgi:hypothetical protein